MAKGLKLLDLRADLLAAENLQLSQDRYAFLRSAYLQNRNPLTSFYGHDLWCWNIVDDDGSITC